LLDDDDDDNNDDDDRGGRGYTTTVPPSGRNASIAADIVSKLGRPGEISDKFFSPSIGGAFTVTQCGPSTVPSSLFTDADDASDANAAPAPPTPLLLPLPLIPFITAAPAARAQFPH
jgi:hypothetical protein